MKNEKELEELVKKLFQVQEEIKKKDKEVRRRRRLKKLVLSVLR